MEEEFEDKNFINNKPEREDYKKKKEKSCIFRQKYLKKYPSALNIVAEERKLIYL